MLSVQGLTDLFDMYDFQVEARLYEDAKKEYA